MVNSSPGRPRLYWRLSTPIDPKRAEALNRRIAHAIGAGKGGWDLGQLLRPVGTPNFKYSDAPRTSFAHIHNDAAYDPDELDRLIPPLPAGADDSPSPWYPSRARRLQPGRTRRSHSPYDLAAWRGELPQRKAVGSVERSDSLNHIGAVLHDAGVAPWLLPILPAERDRSLG